MMSLVFTQSSKTQPTLTARHKQLFKEKPEDMILLWNGTLNDEKAVFNVIREY